jgi:hypothetical protein
MAIEIRHTKRAIVYRVVVPPEHPGGESVAKTFRSKAAAQAWERDVLAARAQARSGAPER